MTIEKVHIPDLGHNDTVDVIELCVKPGDIIKVDQSLAVLESAKASMEVPSPFAGKVVSVQLKLGDKVLSGTLVAEIETAAASIPAPSTAIVEIQPVAITAAAVAPVPAPAQVSAPISTDVAVALMSKSGDSDPCDIYAGPAVRKLARDLGVELKDIVASGPRERLLKDDVSLFVKNRMQQVVHSIASSAAPATGSGIPAIPAVDFSRFGETSLVPMSKIDKITAENMQRAWLNVPHVTQFDEADISTLEDFRQTLKADMETRCIKLTPLAFLLKACANALREHPKFCRSLHEDGANFVQKKYIHIGIAVDTPAGLVVPVLRNVDQKGLWEIAAEITALSAKARAGKLMPNEMQGGCFTVSSLGSIGGLGFTPIVNAPEVAILGVSKTQIKPVWDGAQFVPKTMLPLSLSYDHRIVNGADGGRFFSSLIKGITDIRHMLL